MFAWKRYCLGLLALAMLMPPATAQQPAPVVAAEPQTFWGYMGISKRDKLLHKEMLCKSPAGPMVNGFAAPFTLLSGGIIPSCCNRVWPSDLAKPLDSAEGAAAAIKKSEAEAKARRAAVRYLGTVDCRWHKPAEDALIGALLTDPNECVRFEAALALGRGCCCTEKVKKALELVVEGKPKESAPPENSERVREAAMFALNNCYNVNPDKPKIGETPKEEAKAGVEPAKYKDGGRGEASHEVDPGTRIPTGKRSLSGIFSSAAVPGKVTAMETKVEPVRPMKNVMEPKPSPMPLAKPSAKPASKPPVIVDDFPGIVEIPETPAKQEKPAEFAPLPVEAPKRIDPVESPVLPVDPPASMKDDDMIQPASYAPKWATEPVAPAALKPVVSSQSSAEPELSEAPTAKTVKAEKTEKTDKTGKSIPTGKRSLTGVFSNAFGKKK